MNKKLVYKYALLFGIVVAISGIFASSALAVSTSSMDKMYDNIDAEFAKNNFTFVDFKMSKDNTTEINIYQNDDEEIITVAISDKSMSNSDGLEEKTINDITCYIDGNITAYDNGNGYWIILGSETQDLSKYVKYY
ncbi:MAG: hypothetical protein Q4P18_02565 [Methanobrevibacter sp.]|uniref:hypothetical protein n=1 Tax=Methanobrevibacter sp. TaxID=66852 RepID=UPI0026DFFB72|nr:hypothetical protein [Methanobrevibacter sp.]MDO5848395.1 hypothetical protein [Methanobrevibacter sp.]